jgi:hypothetical protein
MNQNALTGHAVKITHGGETRWSLTEDWDAVQAICDALIAKHGPGVPDIEMGVTPPSAPVPARVVSIAPPVVAPSPPKGWASVDGGPVSTPVVRGVTVSAEGAARSSGDLAAAVLAGFAPKRPIYERGTMVVQAGVDNARRARVEFDKKPTVAEYCSDLQGRIVAEHRQDLAVLAADVQMDPDGDLSIVHEIGPSDRYRLEERAFPGLTGDLGMPPGAGTYLSRVWPDLRAMNVNEWTTRLAEDEQRATEAARVANQPFPPLRTLVLRTRNGSGPRSVYASVTESYTSFDVDRVAQALALATPDGARGTVTYDGYRARFEVLFHSTVQPEDFVAGEFFRAGVIISTDDTGGGSLRGSSVVWQNLCLNLIVIDEAKQDLFRIRHIGSVEKLAARFRDGFADAMSRIDHFVRAWGHACHDRLECADSRGLTMAEAFPGWANGVIERELVPVRRTNRVETVRHLVQAFETDRSSATRQGLTRAALANAFTRYAHTVPQPGPWAEDEIQRAAGALFQSRGPLPYVPISLQ